MLQSVLRWTLQRTRMSIREFHCNAFRQMDNTSSTQSFPRISLKSEMICWQYELAESGVDDSPSSVNYIVAHALGKKTLSAVDIRQTELTDQQRTAIRSMIRQRAQRVPVQYVIGNWDFMNLTLKMKPPILIPRPETEELVQNIIDNEDEPEDCLEIGCGSGAISLALLNAFKKTRVTAIDSNPDACSLTVENAEKYGLLDRLRVENVRLDEDTLYSHPIFLQKYAMMVSNPPYIKTDTIPSLQKEVRDHESREALDGGVDGLNLTRLILKLASVVLKPERSSLWLEVDPSQPELVRALSRQHGLLYLKTFADYRQMPRFCWLRRNGE